MTPQELQCFAYTRGAADARAAIIAQLSWPKSDDLIKKLAGYPGHGWQETADHEIKPMLRIIVKQIDGLGDANPG